MRQPVILVSFTVRHLDRMDHAVNRTVHICDPYGSRAGL